MIHPGGKRNDEEYVDSRPCSAVFRLVTIGQEPLRQSPSFTSIMKVAQTEKQAKNKRKKKKKEKKKEVLCKMSVPLLFYGHAIALFSCMNKVLLYNVIGGPIVGARFRCLVALAVDVASIHGTLVV